MDDLCDALARQREPVLLVIDEVQRASGDAAAQMAALATRLPAPHRLLLAGRRLDAQLARLRSTLGAVHVDQDALAFDDQEIGALLDALLERPSSPAEIEAVKRAGVAWPAASVLAATAIARAPGTLRLGVRGGALEGLLDGLLDGLPEPTIERIGRLAHLPLLSVAVADACAGAGSLDSLRDAGLPLRHGRFGWLELPDPVRDALAARTPLPPEAARAAATAYADAGEPATAVALLGADPAGLAAHLAGRRWQELAALELAELRALLRTLPDDAIAAHPMALVQVARIAERSVDLTLRTESLERAVELLAPGPERREAQAELADARAVVDPEAGVEALADAVLRDVTASEPVARGRALAARARVEAWRGDAISLLAAEEHLGEAAALYRLAGEREWQAMALTALGYRVAFARGDFARAIDHMSSALALLPDPGTERASLATYLAEALAYVGRLDEAEAALREAADIGRQIGDHRTQAYVGWTWTVVASLRGDAPATVQRIRSVERHPGDWFAHPTGAEFLADATCALARVGERELAAEYERRAREHATAVGHPEIAWIATGAVLARDGDPEEAERTLAALARSPQLAPRDEWRTLLFRAHAALRRDDPAAAALAAQAREAVAALGAPELPALHEPDLAAALGAATTAAPSGFRITLLGGFAATAGGRPVEPPPGRPATLVKLLALGGGRVPADAAIEQLWPDTPPSTGRSRLRNLLNRLRDACGELVGRDGDALVLTATAEVDADRFERAASAATQAPAEERAGLARAALALHTGDLLPDDRYEPWAAARRERVRRRQLELLDLLTDDAADRGDLDEAIRLLDQALAAEPLDEDRHVRAAELLLFQGRRGSARALVERAAEIRAGLGLVESPRIARLREATGLRARPRTSAV